MQFHELLTELFKRPGLQMELNRTPGQARISIKVRGSQLLTGLKQTLPVVNELILVSDWWCTASATDSEVLFLGLLFHGLRFSVGVLVVGRLFDLFFHLLLNNFLYLHPRFSILPREAAQSSLQVLTPVFASLSDTFKGLILRFKEGLRKLLYIFAVLKFCCGDLARLLEVTILVQEFVNFVLNFSF